MKKNTILILLGILVVGIAFSVSLFQKEKVETPLEPIFSTKKMKSFLYSKYPEAENIFMLENKEDEVFVAEFNLNGIQVKSEFDYDEKWKNTVFHLTNDELPAPIMEQLEEKYFSPIIKNALRIENVEEIFFSITINGTEKEDGKKGNHILVFDEQGNMEN